MSIENGEFIRQWLREAAQLPADATVVVREELHCPDPACPLRRTVLEWIETSGRPRQAFMVKPMDYVRPPDVQRAWRVATMGA